MMKSCAREVTPGHMASAACAMFVVTVQAMVPNVLIPTDTLTLECELMSHGLLIHEIQLVCLYLLRILLRNLYCASASSWKISYTSKLCIICYKRCPLLLMI